MVDQEWDLQCNITQDGLEGERLCSSPPDGEQGNEDVNMGETIVNMAIDSREVIVHLKGRTFGNRQMTNMAKHMV